MPRQNLRVPGVPFLGANGHGLWAALAAGAAPFLAYTPNLDTSSTGVMANRASSATALDTNEYLFVPKGTTLFMGSVQASLSAASNTGPEGQQTAARATFNTPANFGLAAQLQNIRLEAGTYTLLVDYAAAPGSSGAQPIRAGLATSLQAVSVASPSWGQQFTQTFNIATTGTYSIYIAHENGSKASYDVLFDNVRLYKGSSVSAQAALSGHMRFGADAGASGNPVFTNKLPANSNPGVAVLSTTKTLSEFTCVVAFSQTGASSAGWSPILAGWEDYNTLNINLGNTNNARVFFNGSTNELKTDHLSYNGKGWGILAYRVKDGAQEISLNGVVLARGGGAFGGVNISKLVYGGFALSGAVNPTALPADLGPLELYDSYLSDSAVLTAINSVKTKLTTAGLSLATQKPFYLASGDSITIAANSYAFRMLDARASTVPGGVFATVGVDIATLSNNLTAYQLPSIRNAVSLGAAPIVSVLTGANDTSITTNPTAFYNTLVGMFDQIKTAGGRVMAITVLPKNDSAFNSGRATVNGLLRANPSHYDALADLDTCAAGADSAPFSTTYYSDGIHPTTAGYDAITPVTQAALDAIIASIP